MQMQLPRHRRRKEVATSQAPHGPRYLPNSLDERARAWSVQRILYDNNRNQMLASERAHGGPSDFWAFNPTSLHLNRAPTCVREAAPNPSRMATTVNRNGDGFSISLSPEARAEAMKATLEYCRQHPRVPVTVHAAGARPRSVAPPPLVNNMMRTFCRADVSECLRASLANAVRTYCKATAVSLIEIGPIPDDRLGMVGVWLQRHLPRYALQHCAFDMLPPDSWVLEQTRGVYVLIVQGKDEVGDVLEHAVTVDCAAQTVIDPCEPYHLHLCHEALRHCVGNLTYAGASDVRRVLQHPESSSRRKDPRRRRSKKTQYKTDKTIFKRQHARDLGLFRNLNIVKP